MAWIKHDYEDLPGTYVFDGKQSYNAYALNKMLFSFNEEENRMAFDKDPEAYALSYKVPKEQRELLLKGDYLALLRTGANIYYMAKLAVPNGISVQAVGAAFQGISEQEFSQKLKDKGQNLEEKLQALGGYWHG